MTSLEAAGTARLAARRRLVTGAVGVLILTLVFAAGLAWAKWLPYAHKASHLSVTHSWAGGALFAKSGKPGAAPTVPGAWRFATSYFGDIWEGFLVALVIAAVFDALVPRDWLLRVMNRRTRLGQAVAGGATALPSLMCTCCSSPLTVGLRKRGASTTASLAYWLSNPLLNPAVMVFLFLVLPWQYGVVRIGVGTAVVVGGTTLVTRLLAKQERPLPPELRARADAVPDATGLREFPSRFARSLLRLAAVLIPAYFVVILALGLLSGWLSGFAALDARLGIAAVLVCAVIGTLLVIPTGGEIPVVLALATVGVGAGTAGALLLTLPALSVPSMVLVGRALSWRVTLTMAGVVVIAGLVSGLLLWALL